MPSRRKIPETVQLKIRIRANFLCEYCHTSEQWQYVKFTIDHVVPLSIGGEDQIKNLALACFHCNRRKTNRLTGVDPKSNRETPLFNPRENDWSKHFIWSYDGLFIVGLTPIGRATVAALLFNRERVINIRAADLEVRRHPPNGDPVQEA